MHDIIVANMICRERGAREGHEPQLLHPSPLAQRLIDAIARITSPPSMSGDSRTPGTRPNAQTGGSRCSCKPAQ